VFPDGQQAPILGQHGNEMHTSNVKKSKGHIMLEKEEWVPEEVEDKLEHPKRQGILLSGPASMLPDLPCSNTHKDIQQTPNRAKQERRWLPARLADVLVPVSKYKC